MTYLEAVELIKKIEAKYDLMAVTYHGISVWPLLRINIIDKISGNNDTMKSSGGSAVMQVLSTLFYYNPLNLFRYKPFWLFAGFERRKEINNNNILRVSGCVLEAFPEDTLVVEKPGKNQSSINRKQIPEQFIVSESWILLLVHALAFIIRKSSIKLANEDILKMAFEEYNINFDWISAIKLLIAQKHVIDFLLSIVKKPKKVVIECPYTIMGYVWSLHTHNIPVIELQHGVLNDKHYAYNSLYHSNELYPDEICVFGEDEYLYLKSNECHYCESIHKTGLFFMELAKESFKEDVFKEYRTKYKHIVLVAGQRGYEDEMADYVRVASQQTLDCLYVYVPRSNDAGLIFSEDNIVYKPGINIYECMIWCDLHLTISSTTCLECQYYKKPTIFYNYAEMSVNYYSKVLSEANGAIFTNSVDEYKPALEKVLNSQYNYKEVFTDKTVERIRKVIGK